MLFIQFNDGAEEILKVTQERSRNFLSSIKRLSLSMTDSAKDESVQWPFYTMPNMEIFARDILAEDSSVIVGYSPKVPVTMREDWEQFSCDNQDLVIEQVMPGNPYIPFLRANITGYIHRIDEVTMEHVVEGYGLYYAPVWQMFPVPKEKNISAVNLNLLSDPKYARLSNALEFTREAVVSQAEDTFDIFGIPNRTKVGYVLGPQEIPQILIVQPIFDSFADNSDIIGHLAVTRPWEKYLESIIQDDDPKIQVHCVIKDSCDRPYTYWVNGTHVVYQGVGDMHEPGLDDMEHTAILASYKLNVSKLNPGDYEACSIELSVYPTSYMREAFDSDEPARYLVLVIALSGILTIAFCTHNKAVTQKQRMLQVKTQRSNIIIASLFPEQVREKLFENDGGFKEEGLSLINAGAQKSLDYMLKGGQKLFPGFQADDELYQNKQIADLFPNWYVDFRFMLPGVLY